MKYIRGNQQSFTFGVSTGTEAVKGLALKTDSKLHDCHKNREVRGPSPGTVEAGGLEELKCSCVETVRLLGRCWASVVPAVHNVQLPVLLQGGEVPQQVYIRAPGILVALRGETEQVPDPGTAKGMLEDRRDRRGPAKTPLFHLGLEMSPTHQVRFLTDPTNMIQLNTYFPNVTTAFLEEFVVSSPA